jgi:hypothetical protein
MNENSLAGSARLSVSARFQLGRSYLPPTGMILFTGTCV